MYSVAVKKDFIAQHFLTGGDWGAENTKHSHHYQFEVQLDGQALDSHGYLVDIVNINELMDKTIGRFKDKTLNELAEFVGLNPSVEHLARIVEEALHRGLKATSVETITVRIWEDNQAWAAYRRDR